MLLSYQDHFSGVNLQYTPSGKILQAALEVTMKNTDIFNIKPVCLFVVVVIVCIVQRQSILKMYIYKKRSRGITSGWFSFAVRYCSLVLMVNVPGCLTPQNCTVWWLHLL